MAQACIAAFYISEQLSLSVNESSQYEFGMDRSLGCQTLSFGVALLIGLFGGVFGAPLMIPACC
jgi:hypothetical protein